MSEVTAQHAGEVFEVKTQQQLNIQVKYRVKTQCLHQFGSEGRKLDYIIVLGQNVRIIRHTHLNLLKHHLCQHRNHP
jgi:hypothetical protein